MGEEARVAVANGIVLDFSGLFSGEPPEKQAPTSPVAGREGEGEYRGIPGPEKPVERRTGATGGQGAKRHYQEAQRERELERAREVYRIHQENTKASSQIQTDILKGARAGEDIHSLFLQAAKAISLMTGNGAFYSQLEEDLRVIYGRGLLHPLPLQKELREAQERLQRLLAAEEAETQPGSRRRIQGAIAAHRRLIAELEELGERAEGA